MKYMKNMGIKKNYILEEKINNIFLLFLNEEKCINNDVEDKTKEIINVLKQYISNKEYEIISYNNGIKKVKFSFKINFKEQNIGFNVIHYNFDDIHVFNREKNNLDLSSAKSIFFGKNVWYINLTSYSISGGLKVSDVQDSIQHELNHIFQAAIGSKALLNFNNDFLYNIALKHLQNENEIYKKIAWLLYYAYDFEQDGFVNGLYAYLNNEEHNIPRWEEIRETEIYNAIIILRDNIRFLKKKEFSEKEKKEIKNVFKININEIIKFGERGLKRLLKKMYNVLRKMQNDKGIKFLDRSFFPMIF